MVFDHLLGELLHLLRLGFLLTELRDFDLVSAGPMHQSRDFLVGVTGLTLWARLRPLRKLASLADRLSRLILLRACVLSETNAANGKSHYESDEQLAHYDAPEKWTTTNAATIAFSCKKLISARAAEQTKLCRLSLARNEHSLCRAQR
jgi:hypothetical protein